jgi:hypothetical protein
MSYGLMRLFATLALSCTLLIPYRGAATVFAPGDSKAIGSANFPAAIVADPLRPFTIDFGGGVSISGQVQDRVEELADGTLAFATYIRNITGSAGSRIIGFGRGSFFDPTLEVTWDPTSLGAAQPSLGQRSLDGKTVSVFYDPGFSLSAPGADGNKFVEIRTADTDFAAIGDMFINALGPNNQFGSIKLTVFAPVPEPGTFTLIIAGVALLAAWLRHTSTAKR